MSRMFSHQENLFLQQTDTDVVNVHVDLMKEGHPPVASAPCVLATHHQGLLRAGQVVTLSQDVGVWALIVVVEVVKGPVVWIPRNGALIKPWGRGENTEIIFL